MLKFPNKGAMDEKFSELHVDGCASKLLSFQIFSDDGTGTTSRSLLLNPEQVSELSAQLIRWLVRNPHKAPVCPPFEGSIL